MSRKAFAAALALSSFTAACSRATPPEPASSAAPSTSVSPPAPVASVVKPVATADKDAAAPKPGSVAAEMLAPAKACRAVSVKGKITRESGSTLKTSDVLDRPEWLDLAPGSALSIEHAQTTRELLFTGPGRLLPCDRGEERFFVIRGGVQTAMSVGARPGSEVMLATPYGAVRYGDAKLDVRVGDGTLSVRAELGDAWIDSVDGKSPTRKIAAGTRADLKGLKLDVKALVAYCTDSAANSEQRARDVLTPPPGGESLGALAAKHVLARQAARSACAIAASAVGTVTVGAARDDLARSVSTAEMRWRGLPSRPPNLPDGQKVESR